MNFALEKLINDAVDTMFKVAEHARDQATQHVAQIDKLKVLATSRMVQIDKLKDRINILERELAAAIMSKSADKARKAKTLTAK